MSLYAFHIGQIISTVLGQVDHGGQDGNAARTRIRDDTSETDHTQKRRFRHGAICRTIKALAILRCLCGSEMILLGGGHASTGTPVLNFYGIVIRFALYERRSEFLANLTEFFAKGRASSRHIHLFDLTFASFLIYKFTRKV